VVSARMSMSAGWDEGVDETRKISLDFIGMPL
jgi:hypothetical protein